MMLIIAHGLPVLHRGGVIAPSTPLDLFLFTHLIVTARLYVFIVAIVIKSVCVVLIGFDKRQYCRQI